MPPGYITKATQRAGIVGQIGRAASLQARQAARATLQVKIGQDLVDVAILFSRFLAASMLLH
jgi:hypothetical protein